MNTLFTRLLLPAMLLVPFFTMAQQVQVTAGKANKFSGSDAYFEMLGMKNNKLIVLCNRFEGGKDLFALHLYDKDKDYELVKQEWVEVKTGGYTGALKLEMVEMIGDRIYIVARVVNEKFTKQKYLAMTYDSGLNIVTEWTELLEVDIKQEAGTISGQIVGYAKSDSLIVLATYTISNGSIDFDNDLYDLDFEPVDIEWKSKDLKPTFEEKNTNIISTTTDHYSKGKNLSVYLTSKNSQFDAKPSELSIYFSLYSTSLLVKHDDGKLIDFEDNIYTKDVSCYYDSSDNTFIITGFYNDFKMKRNKPAGIFFIKYDVNSGEVASETYTPLSEEFRKAYKKSTYRKKHGSNEWGNTFYTSKASNGDYFVSRTFWTSSTTYDYNSNGKSIKKYRSELGDIIVFRYDSTGALKGQFFVSKYSAKKHSFNYIGSFGSYIPLLANNDKMFMVFQDNIKNYTEGVYNGKTKKDKGDKKTCLSVIEISKNGQGQRKVLLASIAQEIGVDIYPGVIHKVSNNEYLCYGFKNGTGKVITLKVE